MRDPEVIELLISVPLYKEGSMRFSTKTFLLGLGVGVALTLLVLNVWGGHYANENFLNAQPRLLQPFLQSHLDDIVNPQYAAHLPEPWLPGVSSAPHEGWQMKSLDGKPVTLGNLRGKVVFLDFWASYCGPCVNELASVKRLADSLRNENVAFLLAARDDEPHVREFLRKHPVDLPIYLTSGGAPDMPAVAIPATYFLDRQGAVVFQHIGAATWDTDSVRTFLRSLENR
jgi:thiol-disulfide isomerase/thioredoxin